MTEQHLPPSDNTPAESSMELLGGDATAAAGPSPLMKIARGTLFGVALLGATALLAVSAVPELARYATFGSQGDGASCAAAGAACTTLDKVSFDSPCCAGKSAATACESGSCPLAAAGASEAGSCCATLSRAALLKASADKAGCCESGEECCPAGETVVTGEEPIDAGALLAVSLEQQRREQPSAEQGSDLSAEDDQVEE